MKAILVSSFGPPEVLRPTELPDPAPGPGEVALDVTCAAVGLIDVFIRRGCTVTGPACRNRHTCPGWRWQARCVPWAKALPGSRSASPW
jgi:NADPH2:quinone reductase